MGRVLVWGMLLCCVWAWRPGPAQAAPPDFEDDISIGMPAAALKKFGARPCGPQQLCLVTLWGEKEWDGTCHMDAKNQVRRVELRGRAEADEYAATALDMLVDFAVDPVRVKAGAGQCDAFAEARKGISPEQAVRRCLDFLRQEMEAPELTALYLDEEQLELLRRADGLEAAAKAAPEVMAVRLEIHPQHGVRMIYATLGELNK